MTYFLKDRKPREDPLDVDTHSLKEGEMTGEVCFLLRIPPSTSQAG